MEERPYPNEHACRLNDPKKYKKFRRGKRKAENGKEYSVIFGILSSNKSEEQAYRYDKDVWSASEASSHCKKHGGKFEAAKKEVITEIRYVDIASGQLREVTTQEKEAGILRPVLSSGSKDAHGTRVVNETVEYQGKTYAPGFWRGQSSVPVLYKHGRDMLYGDREMGRWKGYKVEKDGTLVGDPLVFDLKDEFAAERYRKHVEKFADSWSIAFYPTLELSGDDANAFYKEQGIEEDGAPVFLAPQYVEVSDVTFGSNPDAHDKAVFAREFRELISKDYVPREEFNKLTQRITGLEALLNGDTPKGLEALRALARRLKGVSQ